MLAKFTGRRTPNSRVVANHGSKIWRRFAIAMVTAMLLIPTMAAASPVLAAVGTVTVTQQTPNPVAPGTTATLTVRVANAGPGSHGFRVTNITGTGITMSGTVACQVIASGATADFTVTGNTTTGAAIGSDPITVTATEYNNADSCGGGTMATGTSIGATLAVGVQVNFYQFLCPTYSVVPGNENRNNLDHTGGQYTLLQWPHQYALANPTEDTPTGCQPGAGWQFQFTDTNGANPTRTITMDGTGTATTVLTAGEMNLARTGTFGVVEVEQPSVASFAAIRCWTDTVNGDNLEWLGGIPNDLSQIYCLAYNVHQNPTLSVAKVANPLVYRASGVAVTYTYTLTNTGNVILIGPFSVADDKIAAQGHTVTCTQPASAALAPGETMTCTATYTTTAADVTAGSVVNTATGRGTFAGNSVTGTTTEEIDTGLVITKTAVQTSFGGPNVTLQYSYTVTNHSGGSLNNITIVDDHIVGTYTCGSGNLANNATRNCPTTAGTYQTYTTTQPDYDAGSVTNHAYATGTNGGNTWTSNTASVTVPAAGRNAHLTMTKTQSTATYTAGQTINYTIKLTNDGNVTLSLPSVTDPAATGLSCGTLPSTLLPAGVINCTASHTIVQADIDAGSFVNTANGSATFNGVTYTGTASVTATGPARTPHLAMTKTQSTATYTAGQTITYTIKLTNDGNVTLTSPSVTDSAATGLSCGTLPTTLAPAGVINCTASHTIVQADIDAGSFVNTANGSATFNGTTYTGTASVTATGPARNAHLTMTKTQSTATYTAGQTINYTIKLTNDGNVTLSLPSVTDSAATGLSCGTLPTILAPAGVINCTASHTIVQADIDAGSFVNTANGSATFNGVTYTGTASVTATGPARSPSISLTKAANPTTYHKLGTSVTYTYVLTNMGNVTLTNPTVTDNKIVAPKTISCPATPSLAPQAAMTCTATYTTPDANSVTNTATGTATFGATQVQVSAQATITRAVVTITAPSPTRSYGSANPTLVPTFSGFVMPDTSASLTTQPTCTTAATLSSTVGTYGVACSGAVDPDYTFVYVAGILTVAPAQLTATAQDKSRAYGASNPLLTYAVTGFVLGQTSSIVTGSPTLDTAATTTSPVGPYPITIDVGSLAALNYTFVTAPGTLKVTGATPNCTVSGYTVTYDGSAHAVTSGSCTGTDGKPLSGTFDFTATSHVAAGTYPGDAWTFAPTDTNYSSTGGTVTDVINTAALTITAKDQTKPYGTSAVLGTTAFDVSSGLAAGDSVTGVTLTSTGSPVAAAVGTYPIVASAAIGSGLSNYTITFTDGTLKVTGATPNCTVSGYTVTYDGSAHAVTSGSCTGTDGKPLSGTFDFTGTSHTPAGTYPGDAWTFAPTDTNYSSTGGTVTDVINQAAITITAKDQSKQYGTAMDLGTTAFTVSSGSAAAGDITYVTLTSTGAAATATVAGSTYAIVASGAIGPGAANYTITYANGKLTVTKADATCTVTPYHVGYDGNGHTATGGCIGVNKEALTGLNLNGTTHTPAGTYATDAWTFTDTTGNYNNTSGTVSDSITKVNATCTVTPYNVGYDGNAHTATGSCVGAKGEGLSVLNLNGTTHTPVGTYATDPWTFTDSTGNYNNTSGTVSDSIGKLNQLITFVNPGDQKVDVAPFDLGAKASSGLSVAYTVNKVLGVSSSCTVTGSIVTITGAGFCSVTASQAGDATFNPAPKVTQTFFITKYPQTITFDALPNVTYGVAPITLTATSDSGLPITYVVLPGSKCSVSGNTLTITGVGICTVTATQSGNWKYRLATPVPNIFAITKGAITITANNLPKTYGTALTFAGTEFTTTGSVAAGDITHVTLTSTGAGAPANVGTYPIVITAAGPGAANYTITYANGTLTVGPKDLTITAKSKTKAFSQAVTLDGTSDFTASGLANGNGIDSVTLTCAGLAAKSAVADYPIVPSALVPSSGTDLNNYTVHLVNGTLHIVDKPTLTITATNQSKVYGTAATLGTTAFTVDGYSDAAAVHGSAGPAAIGDAVVTVELTSVGAPANAGVVGTTYPIVITPGSATGPGVDNYFIVYVDGTLSVTKANLNVTANDRTKTVGTTLNLGHALFTTTGLVNGDKVTSVDLASTGAAASATQAGTPYDIVPDNATGTGLGNYNISFANGKLTFTDKTVLTVTADDKSRDVSDPDPDFTWHYGAFNQGDDASNSLSGTITCTTADTTGAKPGDTFVITCKGATSEKYTLQYEPGTLTIAGQIVNPATGKPRQTPARTSTGGDQNSDNSVPLFAFLICIAFGGLGLLAVQAQRKSMRS
jgi:uncharacterized repeat protein (TIGR01451 family)